MPGQPFFLGSTNPQKPGAATSLGGAVRLYYQDYVTGGRSVPGQLQLDPGVYLFIVCGGGGYNSSTPYAGGMAVATRRITGSDVVTTAFASRSQSGGDLALLINGVPITATGGGAAGVGSGSGGDTNLSGSGATPPTYGAYQGSGVGAVNVSYGPPTLFIERVG